jgi:hypothetical protein
MLSRVHQVIGICCGVTKDKSDYLQVWKCGPVERVMKIAQ